MQYLTRKVILCLVFLSIFVAGITYINTNQLHNIIPTVSTKEMSKEEYSELINNWVEEFKNVQYNNPLIFNLDPKYIHSNRDAILARTRHIDNFNIPIADVPEEYRAIHSRLLDTLKIYMDTYNNLYLAIGTGDSVSIGRDVGTLYETDKVVAEILKDLNKK